MMSGIAGGEGNPNASWINGRGVWLSYIVSIAIVHCLLLSLPFLSVAATWTLTNVIHSIALLMFLHVIKGTPWEPVDEGKARKLTQWEQIDYGEQLTTTRKFFTIVPVILFFLASFYTKYDSFHFCINFIGLLMGLLPKLPQFHKVRLFGINKY